MERDLHGKMLVHENSIFHGEGLPEPVGAWLGTKGFF